MMTGGVSAAVRDVESRGGKMMMMNVYCWVLGGVG